MVSWISGACPALSFENESQTLHWHGCRLDGQNGKRGPRVTSLGQLVLLSWWAGTSTLASRGLVRCYWQGRGASLASKTLVTASELLACCRRGVSCRAMWDLYCLWYGWKGKWWTWEPETYVLCSGQSHVGLTWNSKRCFVGGLGCPLWH